MVKVLFLITNLAHGGAERVLVNLVNNLDKTKFDVTVMAIFDEGVNKQFLDGKVNYKYIFKNCFRGIKYITKFLPAKLLHKLFIRDNYHIEVSYLEGPPAKIISGSNSKKIAWIHIELNSKKSFTEGFSSIKDAKNSYKKFDKIVSVSKTVSESFKNISEIFDNLCVIYNTNETTKLKFLANEKIDDLTLDKNTINVCSVAKIEHSKGYDRLINVHEKLIAEGIHHHIYILGIGREKNKLEKIISDKNLSDSFTFLGFKENPYKYIKACDLYVCSSRREGFSTAVTEALVLGLPCISTNCSGSKELLGENDEYGLVVENSEHGIYNGLKKMLTDDNVYNKYKQLAEFRGSLFSKEKTVKDVEKLFDEFME